MDQTSTNKHKNYTLATWSLILGIISIPLCLLIIPASLAVVFGIMALVKINQSAGVLTGKGRAIAGLILSGISIILVPIVLVIGAMLYFSVNKMERVEYERVMEKDPEIIKILDDVDNVIEEPVILKEEEEFEEEFIETEEESEKIEEEKIK